MDAFELWCWGRLLKVPRIARRSNQSILKEISPEYSLEGLMLKLKLQLWPPDAKSSLEKTLMLGKTEGRRRRGWQRMRWLNGITNPKDVWVGANSGRWWRTGKPGMLQTMGSQELDTNEWLNKFASCCCCDKLAQKQWLNVWWLKCVIALEVRNEPSKHHQAWVASRGFEEEPLLAWRASSSHLCPSAPGPFSDHWRLLLLSSHPTALRSPLFFWPRPTACRMTFSPRTRATEPGPLQWRCWVLANGPPGTPWFPSCKDPCGNSGPIWIIHNNLFILKVLNWIMAAKSLLPYKVTSSQSWAWGHGCFQRGKGHYSAFTIRWHGGQGQIRPPNVLIIRIINVIAAVETQEPPNLHGFI